MEQIIFFMALIFGFQHAFEADHIGALALCNSNCKNIKTALQRSISWGLGHITVLFFIGFPVLFFGLRFPPAVSVWAEKGVAGILIFYAAYIFLRFLRSRKMHNGNIVHDHPPLGLHIHRSPSFWIGALHGLAGSAAIFIFLLSTLQSALQGLFFILMFGAGSIIGMASAGLVIGFFAQRYQKYAGIFAGVFSCIVGLSLLFT